MKPLSRIGMLLAAAAITAAPLAAQTKAEERRKVVVGENIRIVTNSEGQQIIFSGPAGAYLGVSTTNLTSELRSHFGADAEAGVLVSKIFDDTPASRAGLRVGDVIVSVDGTKVASTFDVSRALKDREKGDQIRIDVIRNGVRQQLFATLDERNAPTSWRLDSLRPEVLERALEAVPRGREGREVRTVRIGGDCDEVRARLQTLESRLRELEKKVK